MLGAVAVIAALVPSVRVDAAPLDTFLGTTLGDAWSTVLAIPNADNPFNGGSPCVRYNGPFGLPLLVAVAPAGAPAPSCTIPFGRSVFVEGWTSECSNAEDPPYHGDNEAELRTCAEAADAALQRPIVTIDRLHLPLDEVETPLLHVTLPADNLFGEPTGFRLLSVAHGWVALLPLLPPGKHTIRITVEGETAGQQIDQTTDTTIVVTRH